MLMLLIHAFLLIPSFILCTRHEKGVLFCLNLCTLSVCVCWEFIIMRRYEVQPFVNWQFLFNFAWNAAPDTAAVSAAAFCCQTYNALLSQWEAIISTLQRVNVSMTIKIMSVDVQLHSLYTCLCSCFFFIKTSLETKCLLKLFRMVNERYDHPRLPMWNIVSVSMYILQHFTWNTLDVDWNSVLPNYTKRCWNKLV